MDNNHYQHHEIIEDIMNWLGRPIESCIPIPVKPDGLHEELPVPCYASLGALGVQLTVPLERRPDRRRNEGLIQRIA